MNKIHVAVLISMGLGSTALCISKTDLEKFERAIASNKIDRVRSLLKSYESKNLSPQERQTFLEQVVHIAHDVVIDRKEKLSLTGNLKYILTYSDREKVRDISLIGIGGLIAALGCWYGKDVLKSSREGPQGMNRGDFYATFAYNSGIAALGLSFGAYIAYKGYACEMQKNALKAAEQIEAFLVEQTDTIETDNLK